MSIPPLSTSRTRTIGSARGTPLSAGLPQQLSSLPQQGVNGFSALHSAAGVTSATYQPTPPALRNVGTQASRSSPCRSSKEFSIASIMSRASPGGMWSDVFTSVIGFVLSGPPQGCHHRPRDQVLDHGPDLRCRVLAWVAAHVDGDVDPCRQHAVLYCLPGEGRLQARHMPPAAREPHHGTVGRLRASVAPAPDRAPVLAEPGQLPGVVVFRQLEGDFQDPQPPVQPSAPRPAYANGSARCRCPTARSDPRQRGSRGLRAAGIGTPSCRRCASTSTAPPRSAAAPAPGACRQP